MTYKTIEYRKKEHFSVIKFKDDIDIKGDLSRLKDELYEVSTLVSAEADLWLVVLMGVGVLSSLLESGSEYLEPQETEEMASASLIESIAIIEKPVIAGIDGDAIDQCLELILACDVRIAAEKSRFGFTQLEKGTIPMNGGTQRLPRLVGKGKALELVLTGETIDAQEAHRIGLVNRVVPEKILEKTVMELAKDMASKSPIALRYAKEAMNAGLDLTLQQGLRLEADLYMLLHTTSDRTEGITAFQEKRKPQFTGK
jgi:enoyl-CoA hydratase/carnithine racemase